ncbi:hypothetical protein AAVH_06105 [Aphelenchoides avenae]|nr:hypothetical protein AAVH_06105 [Aphelenchus avenae]
MKSQGYAVALVLLLVGTVRSQTTDGLPNTSAQVEDATAVSDIDDPVAPTSRPECGPNEEWRTCATCNHTCADPRPICTDECKPAQCQCVEGYVLASNGTCIDVDACPASETTTESYIAPNEGSAECGEYEVFRTCATCNRTCANPRPVCTEECKPAQCQCVDGHVLASNGTCIPEDECSKRKCGPNEEFIYCPGCEPTCKDPYPMCPMRPCMLDENNRGCQCASGYVRNPKGRCVLPADCPRWRCNPPCPQGYRCELKQVWCIRAPCPPQPTCIRTFPWWWVRHWFP